MSPRESEAAVISQALPRRDFLKLTIGASAGLLIGFHFGTLEWTRRLRLCSCRTHLYALAPTKW
jgi:hypothetical protein